MKIIDEFLTESGLEWVPNKQERSLYDGLCEEVFKRRYSSLKEWMIALKNQVPLELTDTVEIFLFLEKGHFQIRDIVRFQKFLTGPKEINEIPLEVLQTVKIKYNPTGSIHYHFPNASEVLEVMRENDGELLNKLVPGAQIKKLFQNEQVETRGLVVFNKHISKMMPLLIHNKAFIHKEIKEQIVFRLHQEILKESIRIT